MLLVVPSGKVMVDVRAGVVPRFVVAPAKVEEVAKTFDPLGCDFGMPYCLG
jgi:hypothetical protein